MSTAKQRRTLSDLNDPQQVRELNRQLTWIWDQLLGGLPMKSLNEEARGVIDSKASGESVDALTGKVAEVETAITQTEEKIELRVTVGQMEEALAEKLDADAPAPAVDTTKAGGGIVIDDKGVRIDGGVIEMNTTDGEGYLHMTSEGISASGMSAPNVMPRYDGPGVIYVDPEASDEEMKAGNYVRSLQDALDKMNGRYVPQQITVNMKAGMTAYDDIGLKGAYFAAGCTIQGGSGEHAKIVGRLRVSHCVGYIRVRYVDVNADFGMSGMFFMGNGIFAHVMNCVITGMGVAGNDNSRCIGIEDGAKLYAENCELYDSEYAVMAFTMSAALLKNIKGNCRYYVDASLIYASGTAACDTGTFGWKEWNAGELRNGVAAVDQGSKPVVELLPQVGTYALTASGSYAANGGWNRFDDADIRQGYTAGAGRIVGCMWFEGMEGLKDREILQANIRLARVSGYGRSSAVSAVLCGITGGYGGTVTPKGTYGVIGTFEAGAETTVTIPTAAIEALAAGEIGGLALYTDEEEVYKDRNYSKNYARFAGRMSEGGEAGPEIEVIYR